MRPSGDRWIGDGGDRSDRGAIGSGAPPARRAFGLRRLLLAAVIGGGAPAPGLAQSAAPLVTDRPDQTESTATVAPGYVQLEIGWTVSQAEEQIGTRRTHTLPELLARIGLTPRAELRVGFTGWNSVSGASGGVEPEGTGDGIGDMELGLKLRLGAERGARPAVALLGGLSLPTGDSAFSSQRADPTFRFSFSHELGSRIALGYNLGAAWASESVAAPSRGAGNGDRERRADFLYTLTLGFGVSERIGVFAETFGFAGLERDRPHRHGVDGGWTLLLSPNLQLDARVGVGLDGDVEDWQAGAGFSLRLPG
ncbi:MAG: transporter [Gemmatimonadota bacterium]